MGDAFGASRFVGCHATGGGCRESSLVIDKEEIGRFISAFEFLISCFTKTQRHIRAVDVINDGLYAWLRFRLVSGRK